MAKIINISENDIANIIEQYKNGGGLESLIATYHIGKLRLKQILADNGVELKKKGGQNKGITANAENVDFGFETRYPNVDGKHYIAVLKSDESVVLNDYINKGGFLTKYIKEHFGKKSTLWERKKYFVQTKMYWWEQWFDVRLVDNVSTKKCPYCDWETIDVDNRCGMFENHLNKKHGISKQKYVEDFPNEKKYFFGVNSLTNRQLETNDDNFVQCKICLRKFTRLGKHLSTQHNLTIEQYKMRFNNAEITSTNFHNEQSARTKIANEKSTFRKESKAELNILSFLRSLNIECESGNRKILGGQEIDIYIPKYKLGIEYDGLLYHNEVTKDKNYHINKTNNARLKGIQLIHIFEDEYEHHKDIVLAKIKHIVHCDNDLPKIYARKCTIQIIPKFLASDFLDKYHIQGSTRYTICYGAYYNKELIAVMTFVNTNEEWELNRFATNFNYQIIGIGGKLFKHFIQEHKPQRVKSFADRRWTINEQNNLYTNIGFKLEEILTPNYSYVANGHKRIHKFACRKKLLYNKYKEKFNLNMRMTEEEMTTIIGLKKIWDCGLLRYVWTRE